eukprot:10279648-Alexandrium_andersonii.AAC.1
MPSPALAGGAIREGLHGRHALGEDDFTQQLGMPRSDDPRCPVTALPPIMRRPSGRFPKKAMELWRA